MIGLRARENALSPSSVGFIIVHVITFCAHVGNSPSCARNHPSLGMRRARSGPGARLALLAVLCAGLPPATPFQPGPDCLGDSSRSCTAHPGMPGPGRLDLVIGLPALPARLPAGATSRIVSAVTTLLARGIFDIRIAVARPTAPNGHDVMSIDVLTPGFVADVAAVAAVLKASEASQLEPGPKHHPGAGAGSCGSALAAVDVLDRVLAMRRRDRGGMGGRPHAHFHVVVLQPGASGAGAGSPGDTHPEQGDIDPRMTSVLANAAALLPRASVELVAAHAASGGCAAELGDPGCEDTYSDGTGLNKAFTATCLLNRGLGTSLQARLLDAGLPIKVHYTDTYTDTDADGDDAAAWLAQMAWSAVGLASPSSTTPDAGWPAGNYGRTANAATGSGRPGLGDVPVGDVPVGTGRHGFVELAIEGGTPVVFNADTVVDSWDAVRLWPDSAAFLERLGSDHAFVDVKSSRTGLFLDQDKTAAMAELLPELHSELGFTTLNMTAGDFFAAVKPNTDTAKSAPSAAEAGGDADNGPVSDNPPDFKLLHFMALPTWLQPSLEPSRELFWTDTDYKLRKQYLWLSSAGAVTHTHFDQDHNFFVQLSGRKRFTLFPAAQHRYMHVYPRLHPLWHKSQHSIDAPDLGRFPVRSTEGRGSVVPSTLL